MCINLTRVFYCPICKSRKSSEQILMTCGAMKNRRSSSSSRSGCQATRSEMNNILDHRTCRNCRTRRELDRFNHPGLSRSDLDLLEMARWKWEYEGSFALWLYTDSWRTVLNVIDLGLAQPKIAFLGLYSFPLITVHKCDRGGAPPFIPVCMC